MLDIYCLKRKEKKKKKETREKVKRDMQKLLKNVLVFFFFFGKDAFLALGSFFSFLNSIRGQKISIQIVSL